MVQIVETIICCNKKTTSKNEATRANTSASLRETYRIFTEALGRTVSSKLEETLRAWLAERAEHEARTISGWLKTE